MADIYHAGPGSVTGGGPGSTRWRGLGSMGSRPLVLILLDQSVEYGFDTVESFSRGWRGGFLNDVRSDGPRGDRWG